MSATKTCIGYLRVSTFEQNTGRQLENMHLDMSYTDKASGKDKNRPKLMEMLRAVRKGDKILVQSIDRLARDVDDLKSIIKDLMARGIAIEFVKEKLVFDSESDSSLSMLMLHVIGGIAEFERSLIRERQKQGIEIAKKNGVYKGRIPKLNADQIVELHRRIENGKPKAKIAREMNISRTTLYEYAKAHVAA